MAGEHKRKPWILRGLILGGIIAALAGLFLAFRSRSDKGAPRRR